MPSPLTFAAYPRVLGVARVLFLVVMLPVVMLLLSALLFAPLPAAADMRDRADSAVQRVTLPSRLLDETLTLQIALPDTYTHSDSFRYPLLIALDGSTHFEHIAASVRFLSNYAIIPEMIVIGVNTPFQRLKYYTPTEVDDYRHASGAASVYLRALQEDVLPALAKDYRIAPYSIISGHSLAGLFTSYLALSGDSAFNAFVSISPSLWWDDAFLQREFERYRKARRTQTARWFLSMASEPGAMATAFSELTARLAHTPIPRLQVVSARLPEETHDSTPLIGNAQALKALFKDWNAVPEVDVMPLRQLQAFYKARSQHYGYQFPLSVHQLNVYGLKAAYEDKVAWGIEILAFGVKRFPYSDILWDSLATAYALNNDTDQALAASTTALRLARQNGSRFLSEISAQHKALQAKARENQRKRP